jgi:hypothetical protein
MAPPGHDASSLQINILWNKSNVILCRYLAEILVHIFKLAQRHTEEEAAIRYELQNLDLPMILSDHDNWYYVTWVCSYWRRVVINAGELWTFFSFDKPRDWTDWRNCRIERARDLPLTLSYTSEAQITMNEAIWLAAKIRTSRAACLDLSTGHFPQDGCIIESSNTDAPDMIAAHLNFPAQMHPRFNIASGFLGGQCPKLRHLILRKVQFIDPPEFPVLECLHLDGLTFVWLHEALCSIMRRTPRLQILHVYTSVWDAAHEDRLSETLSCAINAVDLPLLRVVLARHAHIRHAFGLLHTISVPRHRLEVHVGEDTSDEAFIRTDVHASILLRLDFF